MKKVSIKLETQGLNFYWADKGYVDKNNCPLICSWEDIDFEVNVDNKKIGKYCTTIDTKEFFRYEISNLEGEFGKRMEERCPGYINDELNDTTFGVPMKELLNCNEMLLGFCYDDITDEHKHETSLPNAPYNEFGMKPSYIVIFNPCDNLNRIEVEKSIQFYVEKLFNLGYELEFSFDWINTPTEETLIKEWEQYQDDIAQWEKMKADGIKPEIVFAPEFLIQLFGEEAIMPHIEKGLVHGKYISDNAGDILLTFADGHTEIFKDKDDLFSDHFKEPEWE